MKEIALLGTAGTVFSNVLTALLHKGYSVNTIVTEPEHIMLDTTNVTVSLYDTASKATIRKALEGYNDAVIAYETDFLDAANNDFILRTYAETVNAAIEAGVKRLVVVGNKDSEAFFATELKRRSDLIDGRFISTEGCYACAAADAI